MTTRLATALLWVLILTVVAYLFLEADTRVHQTKCREELSLKMSATDTADYLRWHVCP